MLLSLSLYFFSSKAFDMRAMLFSNHCHRDSGKKLKKGLLFTVLMFVIIPLTVAGQVNNRVLAQDVMIETSAGAFEDRFFGEGVIQVVVTDPDADANNTVEEIQVDIEADPEAGSSVSDEIFVPETTDSSGRFEFFLVHVNSDAVGPEDLNSVNSAGVEGDGVCAADCAPFITFGPEGDLNVQSNLFEPVTFEITIGNAKTEVKFEETAGILGLDRYSFGTTSYVYISITDQDANLNPFENDEFTVDPDIVPNDDLFVLTGGTFEDVVVFRETGDNTAIFEARYRLGESMLAENEVLALTLQEKANYNATLAAPENDSNNIDEVSFVVGDADGNMDVGGGQQTVPTWDASIEANKESYKVGETADITITDQDANGNSTFAESIRLRVTSIVSQIEITAHETGENTGVFLASFTFANKTDAQSSAILPGGWATITYTDERPADYFEKVQAGQDPEKEFSIEIDVELPIKTGIESTNVTAPVIETMTVGTGPFEAGMSLTLLTTITNNNERSQPFVAMIEVRDSSDVTVFLALQSATLEPSGSADIGVLWQPKEAGAFEVRTFAITSISDQTDFLSLPATSEITIT
jgi:hypothetical protein